jgi:hypothetical protein
MSALLSLEITKYLKDIIMKLFEWFYFYIQISIKHEINWFYIINNCIYSNFRDNLMLRY